jgi:hypothetical protein
METAEHSSVANCRGLGRGGLSVQVNSEEELDI